MCLNYLAVALDIRYQTIVAIQPTFLTSNTNTKFYLYFVQYSFEFVYLKESDIIKYGLSGAQMNTILNNVKTCNNFVLIIFLTSEFVLCLCFLYNRKPILCFWDFFPVKQETN